MNELFSVATLTLSQLLLASLACRCLSIGHRTPALSWLTLTYFLARSLEGLPNASATASPYLSLTGIVCGFNQQALTSLGCPTPTPAQGASGGQRGTISWELGSGSLYPWLSPVYLFLLELNSLLKHSPDHLLLTAWCGE